MNYKKYVEYYYKSEHECLSSGCVLYFSYFYFILKWQNRASERDCVREWERELPYPGVVWPPPSWWIFGVNGTGEPPDSSDGVFDRNKLPPSSDTNVIGELIFIIILFDFFFHFFFICVFVEGVFYKYLQRNEKKLFGFFKIEYTKMVFFWFVWKQNRCVRVGWRVCGCWCEACESVRVIKC